MGPLLLLACALLGQKPAENYSVPFELLRTGHIAVKATINGKGPFRMALDTGSPVTFVDNRVAATLGLVKESGSIPNAPMGIRMPVKVQSVDVGGAKVADLTVLILDHPTLRALEQVEGRLDGIVGFSFFSRFRTTLEYAKGRIELQPVAYRPQDVLETLMARLSGNSEEQPAIAPAGLWGWSLREAGGGVEVAAVGSGGAASTAGLRTGDRVLSIDGRWAITLADCYEAAATLLPGRPCVVRVNRSGEELALTVRPRPGL